MTVAPMTAFMAGASVLLAACADRGNTTGSALPNRTQPASVTHTLDAPPLPGSIQLSSGRSSLRNGLPEHDYWLFGVIGDVEEHFRAIDGHYRNAGLIVARYDPPRLAYPTMLASSADKSTCVVVVLISEDWPGSLDFRREVTQWDGAAFAGRASDFSEFLLVTHRDCY